MCKRTFVIKLNRRSKKSYYKTAAFSASLDASALIRVDTQRAHGIFVRRARIQPNIHIGGSVDSYGIRPIYDTTGYVKIEIHKI